MKINSWRVAAFAAATALILSSCAAGGTEAPDTDAGTENESGGTLIIGGPLEPNILNPAIQSGTVTNIPGSQLFVSPVLLDDSLEPVPYGAESWEFVDDLTLHIDLRTDLTFHDGTPVTAEDLKFSIETVKAFHPQGGVLYSSLEDIVILDEHSLELELSQPAPAILKAMTPMITPIIPKAIYGDGQDLSTHPRNTSDVVGSGPFKLKEFSSGDKLVLEKYEDFFLSDRVGLDSVIVKFLPDQDTASRALQNGEIHLMVSYDPTIADRLSDEPGIGVADRGYEGQGTLNLIETNTKNEYLSERKVRQAIAHSIDRESIINELHRGYSKQATGPVHPDGEFYDAEATNPYDFDLDRANELLDEAGFPVGDDGYRFELRFDFMPGSDVMGKNVAETIAHQLQDVGIKIELRPAPDFATWAERVSNYDFDLTMDNISNGPDPVLIEKTYACKNIREGVIWANMTQYCNEEIDELFSAGATEPDPVKRFEIYSEMQRILSEDSPVLYVETQPIINIYQDSVENPPNGVFGVMFPIFDTYIK